jgi:hypothetical protein
VPDVSDGGASEQFTTPRLLTVDVRPKAVAGA